MNLRIAAAIFRKDVLCLLPLLAVTVLLFLADGVINRLELLPVWTEFGPAVLLVAMLVLVLSVFQLDPAAGLTDDWLCRPLRIRELLAAKFALVLSATGCAHAIGIFAADLGLGLPLGEAVQDALLLPSGSFPSLLLLFLFAAIVTRTFVQGFGVLFAIFICVFALPTPFVRPAGPLTPGIRDELWPSGMAWLATCPAWLACALLLAVGFWLAYRRRRLLWARVLLAVSVVSTLLLVLLPIALLPWDTTFAIQKTLGPAFDEPAPTLTLRNPGACFPATLRSALADPAFDAARRKLDLDLWSEAEALRGVDPDSVAFLTNFEPRGLPLDWRVKLNYVRANYLAGGETLYSLRPAGYLTDGGRSTLAHAWMLPEPVVQRLRDLQPALQLTYSLTLLEPKRYEVRIDDERQSLPGLGYCSAKLEQAGKHVVVDCFSPSPVAQISAELPDIPATRVYGSADLAPGWARWPFADRVRLQVGSPRLSRRNLITVTAWRVAGYTDESITLPGILGADLATCPLPTGDGNTFQKARWGDTAPHEAHSVSVEPGVQLEVLDFGGKGSPIVLLPGLGATAHSYDELAPQLAAHHRVIAITRRGTGYSSKPDFGFDTPRLSRDVLVVMDQLNLPKALLVGHSIAGEELTWLGGHEGERFTGLVYLDAAYDRSNPHSEGSVRLRELSARRPPEPPVPPEAWLDYEAATKWLAQRGHSRYPEGELIAFLQADKPYLAGTPNIDGRSQQAILAALEKPDYSRVKIPALAIYAFADPEQRLPPWYDADDQNLLANLAEARRITDTLKRTSIGLFRAGMEKGEVLELQKAEHYLIQSNLPEVRDAIESFAARIDRP